MALASADTQAAEKPAIEVVTHAGAGGGSLRTPPVVLAGKGLTVNARIDGELRVRLVDPSGEAIEGFDWSDCRSMQGDLVRHEVQWKEGASTPEGRTVRLEFALREAQLYGFDVF